MGENVYRAAIWQSLIMECPFLDVVKKTPHYALLHMDHVALVIANLYVDRGYVSHYAVGKEILCN
jgi:hypothetical protein